MVPAGGARREFRGAATEDAHAAHGLGDRHSVSSGTGGRIKLGMYSQGPISHTSSVLQRAP